MAHYGRCLTSPDRTVAACRCKCSTRRASMCAQVDRPNATSRQPRRISSPSRAKIAVQLTTDGRAKLTAYQRQPTLFYAANVRRRLGRKRPGAADFVEWLADHADLLGLDFPPAELALSVDEPSAADWRRMSVTNWTNGRLRPRLRDLEVSIIDGNFGHPHGRTKMRTLRASCER